MYSDDIISFTLFGKYVGVNLYGIFFALGIVAALVVFLIYAKKMKMAEDAQNFMYFVGIFGIVAGYFAALLFQSFYNFLDDGGFGKATFELGGITFLGGLIGGISGFCAVFFIAEWVKKRFGLGKSHVKEFWKISQIMPCSVTLAHAFGRLGCMFGDCCYGAPTDKWYGFFGAGKVPTHLFESLFLIALFVVLTWLLFNTKLDINLSVYLISYGVWRTIIEIFRNDERGTFLFGLQPSQFWAIVMVIIGIGLLITKYLFKQKKNYDFPC